MPADEFTSVLFPILVARERGTTVREVAFERLPDEIGPRTTLVALSLVQMQTGRLADLEAILDRAAEVGARVLVDATQAIPFVPFGSVIDRVDYLVAAAYKHLLCPRGVAFLVGRPGPSGRPVAARCQLAVGGLPVWALLRRPAHAGAGCPTTRRLARLDPVGRGGRVPGPARLVGVDGCLRGDARPRPRRAARDPVGRGIARLRADQRSRRGERRAPRRRRPAASRGADPLLGPRLHDPRRHRARGPSHRTVPDPLTHGRAMLARGVPHGRLTATELDHARRMSSAIHDARNGDVDLAFRTVDSGRRPDLHPGQHHEPRRLGHPILEPGTHKLKGVPGRWRI